MGGSHLKDFFGRGASPSEIGKNSSAGLEVSSFHLYVAVVIVKLKVIGSISIQNSLNED